MSENEHIYHKAELLFKEEHDDEEEEIFRDLLFKGLHPNLAHRIGTVCRATNLRWSAVVEMALVITDWGKLEDALNVADGVSAVIEAEDIIGGEEATA